MLTMQQSSNIILKMSAAAFLAAGSLWLSSGTMRAETRPEADTSSINVKDFGAVGDGQTDDTGAIQRAVNAAGERDSQRRIRAGHYNLTGGIGVGACTEIVFPPGRYRLTAPVVFPKPVYLRGMGNPVIVQSNPEQDVFYFHANPRGHLDGLSFQGGKTQLKFWTDNSGGVAEIVVRNCRFADSKGFAVECQSYTREKFAGEDSELDTIRPWAPYTVAWDNGLPSLTPNPSDHLIGWFNSTLLTISGCEFIQCAGVADMQCDTGVIEDSRIETSREAEGPAFNLPSGKTHLYRVKGLAHLNPEKDAYWIEGGGILSVRDCDFDTDGADGWDFLRASQPVRWTSIQIGFFCVELENTRLKVGGSRHNAICWFSKDNQPSILSFRSLTETSGQPVQAVVWEAPPTEAILHSLLPPNNPLDIPAWFHTQFAGNSVNVSLTLPEILASTLETSIPDDILEKTRIAALDWGFEDLQKSSERTIMARDFGIKLDSKEDASAVIQKIFDEAGKSGQATVLFPSGVFRISRTIQLPSKVTVEAAGRAIIVGDDPERALFSATDAREIGFRGFVFAGGKDGFDLSGAAEREGRVAFEGCSFMDQGEAGIRYLVGQGEAGEKNRAALRVSGGAFLTMQGLVTNAGRSQVERMWLINDPRLNEAAFIENRGGEMRVGANLANPRLWAGKRSKRPDSLKDWKFSSNTRWIDNSGRLFCLDNRFGGESGGMANIFHRAGDGSIFVGGGTTRFFNGLTKKAIVYLEHEPGLIALQNISAVPVSMEGAAAVLTAPGVSPDPQRLFYAGLFAPVMPR